MHVTIMTLNKILTSAQLKTTCVKRAKFYYVNVLYVCDVIYTFYVIRTLRFDTVNISSVQSPT